MAICITNNFFHQYMNISFKSAQSVLIFFLDLQNSLQWVQLGGWMLYGRRQWSISISTNNCQKNNTIGLSASITLKL